MIFVGILAAAYVNIYMLITGIIDIIHGSSILWGIAEIALREFVGLIIIISCIVAGGALISKSK